MKLHDKQGSMAFLITNPETGSSWEADIPRYLPKWQYKEMAWRPDIILQFAHYLAGRETQPGHKRVEVRAEIVLSLNGRRAQDMIDPDVNLAEVQRSLLPAPWITNSLRRGGDCVLKSISALEIRKRR